MTGISLLAFDGDQPTTRVRDVEVPPELAARRDGVDEIAAAFDPAGDTAVIWVETTEATERDGRRVSSAALRSARPGSAAATPYACTACKLAAALAPSPSGTGFVAVVRASVDDDALVLGRAPIYVLVRIAPDGVTSISPAPWLASGLGTGISDAAKALSARDLARGDLATYIDARGHLVVRADAHVYVLGKDLGLVAAPRVLPSADGALVLDEAEAGATLAFSRSPAEDGRSIETRAKRDVFLDMAGRLERVSAGRLVLGLDRLGEGAAGVAFESAGSTWFGVLDGGGRKLGGDVLVRATLTEGPSEYGVPTTRRPLVVVARPGPRWVLVEQGETLTRTEVTCGAP